MRNNIDDDKLFEFLCDILNDSKIKFIKQIESVDLYNKELKLLNNDCFKEVIVDESSIKSHKYKLKLSSILRNFISLEKKPNRVQLIKARKYVLQKLWTYFVRNAIKLLRQYDRRDLGELKFDFGVKNLTDYFEEFSIFEELLYGLDDYYRDHTLHVFRVYLLGDFIIRTHIPGGYEEITIFDQPREIKIKNNEKEAMWCIIALCHDLGYPLERIDNLNKKLIKILDYFGTSHFQRVRYSLPFEGAILDKFILKLLSSKLEKINDSEFKTNIQTKFYTKFSNAYEKLSHGMMSCVLLMKNLVYFKESDFKVVFKNNTNPKDNNNKENNYLDDVKQYLIRREVLRAIASHDNQDIYHINMNNFSFLLIICDEIQEWSRPVAKRRIYYEIEKEKPEIVSIHNFNNKTIDISIKLNLVEDEIEKYSIIKFQNFIRLLRSAVDSDSRTFDFKLLIKNYEEIEFIFEYDNPHDFYKGGVSEEEQYNPPRIEKKQPDGTPDPNFTLKSITEF